MLCVTGLPLIFHDEIETLEGANKEAGMVGPASATDGLPLDRIVAQAVAQADLQSPGNVPLFIGFSQESPLITVTTGPAPDAPGDQMRLFSYNRMTGEDVGEIKEEGVMHFLLELHTDMFLGLPGMLFLGVMGVLFVVAILSGLILYVPFMRKLRFGTMRTNRSTRLKRLDIHNYLGIVTLAWALVVGLTGVINAFTDPLTESWRDDALGQMKAAYVKEAPLSPAAYGSLDTAMAKARTALPGRSPQFVAFPGGMWSTGHHYAIFFQGDTPLTSHVLTPALMDARTGALTDSRDMPILNQALMLSKPLHFGDYGGLPLKIVWAFLDLATIYVLGSGLYLWFSRRTRSTDAHVDALVERHIAEPDAPEAQPQGATA